MRNATTTQLEALDELAASGMRWHVWADNLGAASFARGDFGAMGSSPPAAISSFLADHGHAFGPTDIRDRVRPVHVREDSLGWRHYEYQQIYAPAAAGPNQSGQRKPLDVEGAFLVFHVNAAGHLVEIQSSCWRDVFALSERQIDQGSVRRRLAGALARRGGAGRLVRDRGQAALDGVVLLKRPVLVVFPYQGGFRPAWRVRTAVPSPASLGGGAPVLVPGLAFLDAVSGELLYEGITVADAETPDLGSGLGNLPFGGPFHLRQLQIVRVDSTATYRLRDTTHERNIVTYDWDGALPDYFDTGALLDSGAVPVSSDTDGDKKWNDATTDDSEAALTESQQTEVDAHFNVGDVYRWYDALAGGGGRQGFDDEKYASGVPNDMPVHLLAHVAIDNAQFYMTPADGREVSYLSFSDATGSGGHRAWAASPFVVCHEYQHGVTAHSVGGVEPGYPTGFDDWARALGEGLSDVFGGMYSRLWYMGAELSVDGSMIRNLAFPRDPEPTTPNPGKDHWDDRDTDDGHAYPRGQILAHCAYLMAQGGVHHRAGRNPELIPVHPLADEESGGLQVSPAARVWYRVMASRFASLTPYSEETAFVKLRTECEASAIDLYGENSAVHRCVVQAFYAVGLHPEGEAYGADVTALRWGHSWRFSRPYLGIPSPNWASPDLFINNGGSSDWNAIVNVDGADTEYENAVYCRVRNVGDQTAHDVAVSFHYAKCGTAPVVWMPMRNADGVEQELTIESLAAGESNFGMGDQDSPPESARALWSVPPAAPDEEVDHYCIRADISAANDVNPHNGAVQSNVAYTMMAPMLIQSQAFNIGNPGKRPLRPDLELTNTLPAGWQVHIREDLANVLLPPGTERKVHIDVERPAGSPLDDDSRCSPPFDGEIRGELGGSLCGAVSGVLGNARGAANALTGTIALRLNGGGLLSGRFDGRHDCLTGRLTGHIAGVFQCGGRTARVCVALEGCLRPFRLVEIRQLDGARTLGGVTFWFQLPMSEVCRWPQAPTDTSAPSGPASSTAG